MRRISLFPRLKLSPGFFVLFAIFFIFNLLWLNSHLTSTSSSPGALERSLGISTGDNNVAESREQKQPDGFFNGFPVYLSGAGVGGEGSSSSSSSKKYFYSTSHCIGENYQSTTSWMHRSCHYTFMCFDMEAQDFVIFEPPDDTTIPKNLLKQRPFADASQSFFKTPFNNNSVSLGGINIRWTMNEGEGAPRLRWSPRIVSSKKEEDGQPKQFYALDENVVMVPFHSLNGGNPGHLVWDDFLPIYTLMTIFFDLADTDNSKVPLPLRYVLKDGRGLWASCDFNKKNREACNKMHTKFWPLMRTTSKQSSSSSTFQNETTTTTATTKLTSIDNFEWKPPPGTSTTQNQNFNKSKYICARHGLAGIGDLTDHGTIKTHGWENTDYTITHNHGRTPILYAFRNFAMRNVGIIKEAPLKPPFKIIFSTHSSSRRSRNIHFQQEVEMLQHHFDPSFAVVEEHLFKGQSLKRQLEIASSAAIFITGCGGGAVTATFVQKGAAVFAYYARTGGLIGNIDTGEPARLDWDLLNNLGYARVHWMPKEDMKGNNETLLTLVQNELNRILLESEEEE